MVKGQGMKREGKGVCCGALSLLALCSGFEFHARFHS